MLILPFDTESTGFPSKSQSLTSMTQPHLVSLSALQVESDTMFVQQSTSKLVEPDGWSWDDSSESSDNAYRVHQIKLDYAQTYGRPEKAVLDEFLELWNFGKATPVAHNFAFDKAMISVAIARYYGPGTIFDTWMDEKGLCTQRLSAKLVNARTKPNAEGKTRAKQPNLAEAYEFFTGEPLIRHHSANIDAVACLQIWVGIQEHADLTQ